MELVAVDARGLPLKNGHMTKEERKRIGRKLRAMRTERGLDQVDVVSDAKADGLSLGTLQAIESAWYEVRDVNIEKYARFFGTSATKLLKADEPKVVAATDPLLKDLHEEHLEVARSYMRARKRVRACVEVLLNDHPEEEHLTRLFMKLEKLPAERLARIEVVLGAEADDPIEQLLTRVRRRIEADPTYLGHLSQGLALEEQPAPVAKPTAKATTEKKRLAPPRRA
jgi:hypothetical protein